MGQYQQWLHFQEVDRQLRAELESLENELQLLQDRVRMAAAAAPRAENSIVYALLEQSNRQRKTQTYVQNGALPVSGSPNGADAHAEATISAALLHWGGLPDFGAHPVEAPFSSQTYFRDHPEPGLLPEDMVAFFDQHSNTAPRLQTPWWLHGNLALDENDETDLTHPLDPETVRTNERIQRWIERWKRHAAPSDHSEEARHE